MLKKIKYIFLWFQVKISILMIYIAIALRNTELTILKSASDEMLEKQKQIQRRRHRNQTLEKFYSGLTDEKYVQEYYEILKKADKFIRTASPHQYAIAADKQGMVCYGKKDEYGRRYDHYGFFDPKHKHSGKSLTEVLNNELMERKTKDDNFELLYIFNNIPISVGLSSIDEIIEEVEIENKKTLVLNDLFKISKKHNFPIKVFRKNLETVNKIEELTDYLHVKRVGFEFRRLEFFIPIKFGTTNIETDSKIFKELIDISDVYFKNKYGERLSFGVTGFAKRIINEAGTHEVIKFDGFEMENIV
jgi:hypothetical protein